ncbi:MAG: polysulfide reductase NrfD [Deltaproteobacteria bacterium]|nr:polysulfide reductase NrfD [Deltaproteobacteria bacterium]
MIEHSSLTYADVNHDVTRVLWKGSRAYWAAVGFCFFGILVGAACWGYQIATGLGMVGINVPVAWSTYLVNFVFWVGIAHSGTLISAILFLLRARWRTAISRSAEAMTVIAIVCAGLFPFIHLGRVWIFYWIIPYPNQRLLWPNFQSPLVFDFVAISTYLTVSFLFWYTGMIPDLAVIRDQATGWKRKIYGALSLNWVGSHRQWHHYGAAYVFFAALATPLVISVHSVVSWDFALSILPGWHSTIFPPYFVAGAIHSGLAMVLVLLIPLRKIYGFEHIITESTLENVAKTLILTCAIMGYSYATEYFVAWYSREKVELGTFIYRATGHYSLWFWLMILCNAVLPYLFFVRRLRTHPLPLFVTAVLVVFGMWLERYVIIIGAPTHADDPYVWRLFQGPTWMELGVMFGSFSLFFFAFLLFAKFLPTVSIAEVKEEAATPAAGGEAAAP